MICPICWNTESKVLDSRVTDDLRAIKRRRECLNCQNRFNTFEKYEKISLTVEKSIWKMEEYNEEKLYNSILKSFNKRWVSVKVIDDIMFLIEQKIISKRKITSKDLWDIVLEELKKVDEVAYIRYASVFLDFKSKQDFLNIINL